METLIRGTLWGHRFSVILIGLFSIVALILAAAGVYGVTSYSVSQRTREFGVRMALGAASRDVARLVVQAVRLIVAGVSFGILGSLILGGSIANQLYAVSPRDSRTMVAVSLFIIAIALSSCYFPVRRATSSDPMAPFRTD